jgi:hypothetical protein
MPVPAAITDCSSTAASNSPAGSEAIGTNADDYIRQGFKFMRDNYGPGYTVTGSSVPANGVYLSAANTFAIASNTTIRYAVNSTGGHSFATPTSGTTTVTISGANLGTTDGNSTEILSLNYASGNTDRLSFIGYRRDNDTEWSTAETRIQRVVDVTGHGFIAFGDGGEGTPAGPTGLILGGENREAIYINDSGNVTVNTPASGNALIVSGDVLVSGSATAADFIETSTRELKSEIVDVEAGALARIKSLGIREYKFDGDDRKRVGVIAEEVDARYSVNGNSVSLTNIIFDLVAAVKELEAQLAAK